jgi:hypothetical protein
LQREAGWKDNLVFSEYFYGGSVAGLGAAHRTEPRTRRNGLIAGTSAAPRGQPVRRHPPTGAVVTAMTDRSPPRSGRAFGLDMAVARLTPAERAERGKAARSALPREGHAVFDPPADRADPVDLLERQAASRLRTWCQSGTAGC